MIEFNPFFKKYRRGLRRVAVVYPNRYVGGISNLGIQRLYYEVNKSPRYIAERFYLDVFDGIRSVENGSELGEFDVALFSIQYEEDFFNALKILKKSNFKGLKIAGGPCITQNPFPALSLFDSVFVGEVEGVVLEVVENRNVEGLIPNSYRRRKANLDSDMRSQIVSEGAYGRSLLVEIGRGCPRGCRFCIVRQIYSPTRWRRKEEIVSFAEENKELAEKIAIISPSPTDHPNFKEIVQELRDLGFSVSPSSIRADRFDEEMAELLKDIKTLTIAPEAGTERLREILNKNIENEEIYNVVEISKNVERVKLYFMFGIPGERKEDLDSIIEMVKRIRGMGKRVSVSINPLVPKPNTPFQWLPFGGDVGKSVEENIKELEMKREYLYSKLKGMCEVRVERIDAFAIQTVISRGDERVGKMFSKKPSLRYLLKSEFSRFLDKIPPEQELPWDRVEMGYKKRRLLREFERTLEMAHLNQP